MTGLEKAAVDGALRKAVARLEGGRAGQVDMALCVHTNECVFISPQERQDQETSRK